MKTKTVERLLNETPEEVKNDVSEYADKVAGLGGIINFNSTIEQPPSLHVVTVPNHVGYYCLGGNIGFCIAFAKKPNWFHRTMMKVCLGWEWKDKS